MAGYKAQAAALRATLPRERLERMLQAHGYASIAGRITDEGCPVSENTVKRLVIEYGITPPRQGRDWLGKRKGAR